jgi:NitT/TauT family transport system substrate-binding protein
MINKGKIAKLLTSLLVFILFATSCGQNQIKKKDIGYTADVIRIQYTTAYSSAVQQILMRKDFLQKVLPDNVKIEWVNINTSSDMRDALVAGQIDIASMSKPSIITAIGNELPVVILSNTLIQLAKLYSNNPDISSMDDIKKTSKIAINGMGSTVHLALMLVSKELYGDPSRFNSNLVSMQYSDIFASITSSKELDCMAATFPNLKKADKIKTLKPILDLTPIIRQYDIGVMFCTRQQFFNDNPELIDAFNKASSEAIDFMNEQPAEAAKLLSEFYGEVDAQDIEEQLKNLPPTPKISESAYDQLASLMYEAKILDSQPKKFSKLPNYDTIPKTK